MDRVAHRDVVYRAARKSDIPVKKLKKGVKQYLDELAGVLSEADPERKVKLPGVGDLKVEVHDGHSRWDFQKEERVEVPAYRMLKIDASRRIRKTLKLPLKDFYEEYK